MRDDSRATLDEGSLAPGASRRRAVRGVRAALLLNLLALPLSFVTNMILARISPEALGVYGAVQIFVGWSFTFLVLGGANVFTRFVPALDEPDRISFLRSYTAVVAAVCAGVAVVAFLVPGAVEAILRPLGAPDPASAVLLVAASSVCIMAGWYLYADKESTWAVGVEKLVILGFFVTGLAALAGPQEAMRRGDASFLWRAAFVVYATAAAVALWRIARTPAFAARRRGWLLPHGFWPVVGFTHTEKLVSYVYVALAPSVIVLWVDLRTLGFLHAALRYTVLMTAFPAAVMAVLGPELRRLVAGGDRDEAVRQASFAVRIGTIALAPVVFALVVFAEPAMAVFGPSFREQADLLRWVAPSVLAGPVVLCGASFAVAVGVFRAYLQASIIYVVIAMALLAVLVPGWGVIGAAAAMTLGALGRQTATVLALRRDGFLVPRCVTAAWACAAGGMAGGLWGRPSPPVAAAWLAVLLAAFWWLGGIERQDVSRMVRWGLGRR